MNWYLTVLKRYAQFEGRASRSEYWFFVLFNIIVSIILVMIDRLLHLTIADGAMGILTLIYSLGVLLPSIAVGVRRLHDTSRSGWWMLLAFVPIASLVLIVFFVLDSTPGTNQYGSNPKGVEA
jgi:uncharacterized membrane protein YhaH (DUF805 family)